MPNLVKYCVDCFSLLFSVPVVLGTSPAASSLRLVGGFLRGVVVLRATGVSGHWARDCTAMGDGSSDEGLALGG